MPPCNPNSVDSFVSDISLEHESPAARKVFKLTELKDVTPCSDPQAERPYPWNLVSDRTHYAVGTIVLVTIFFPTLLLIFLSTAGGHLMYYGLYKYNPPLRLVLDKVRTAQQWFFQKVGNAILLDPRDSSYLPWMTWSLISLPLLFYWAHSRYTEFGFELSTFLVYHFLRLGPRYRFFAHHETLIHKEGHAVSIGLFRNIFNQKVREPVPKLARRLFFDHINGGLIGPFYGSMPYHYATAHNKIHHRWHNDTGDVHTNMDVDRTVPSSFILWIPRFVAYWTGVTPLILFWKRKEYRLLKDLAYGMTYYYTLSFLIWYNTDALFYWAYWLYPLLEAASFLGGIAYIWHAFSESTDCGNQYINSVTILRGHDNIWNEDFHVVHHHEPNVHWTNMPESFVKNKAKYVECRATVFADCEQGVFFAWMFGRKWDDMVDHFVDLQYLFSNGEKNSDKLMNVKEVVTYERSLRKGKENEVDREMRAFHGEVKEMLLRRLRYHYMGDRKQEWKGYSETMNEGLRDFGKTSQKQS